MNSDTALRNTVTLTQEVDAQEFFENLLGSAWETWTWWHVAKYANGYEWDKYPTDQNEPFLTVGICDPDDDNEEATVTKSLSLNDLVKAYGKAQGYAHLNWEDHDSCTGDIVMQTAVLGEVVYG
jgi:hypothetical protein